MAMKKKKQNKLSVNQAANKIADIIGKHLEPLPPAERRRRISKAHARVVKAVAKKKVPGRSSVVSAKPLKRVGTFPSQFPADSH